MSRSPRRQSSPAEYREGQTGSLTSPHLGPVQVSEHSGTRPDKAATPHTLHFTHTVTRTLLTTLASRPTLNNTTKTKTRWNEILPAMK